MWLLFLFFKQKTAYEMRISDWSSDVCSSDLAVILAAYEWSKQAGQPEMVIDNYEGPASQASIDGLVGQVDDALEAAGYYHVPARVASSKRTLRNLLTRPGWSEKEVRTLRGIVHALVEGRRGVRPRG